MKAPVALAAASVAPTTAAPFLRTGEDYSKGGGTLVGRLGGPTADLRASVITEDTSAVGSGRGVTLIVTLMNEDDRPVYLNSVKLLEVYFLQKKPVWNLEEFKSKFATAVKSGAGMIASSQLPAVAYKIDKTDLYYAKYNASSLVYEGNTVNGMITIYGKSVSQLKAIFDTPKINREQFNVVIEAIEFDVLNSDGFPVMRLCPLSVFNTKPLEGDGGYQGWNPILGQPFQVVPNDDQTVVCQPVTDTPKDPPAGRLPSPGPQQLQ